MLVHASILPFSVQNMLIPRLATFTQVWMPLISAPYKPQPLAQKRCLPRASLPKTSCATPHIIPISHYPTYRFVEQPRYEVAKENPFHRVKHTQLRKTTVTCAQPLSCGRSSSRANSRHQVHRPPWMQGHAHANNREHYAGQEQPRPRQRS